MVYELTPIGDTMVLLYLALTLITGVLLFGTALTEKPDNQT